MTKLECSTPLRRNWIDPKYWTPNTELRIGSWLNSSNWRNSNWKPNSCLIPTLSLDDPLTLWEIISEATPSRAPEIAVKPKLLPWYEMMTTSCPNSDGGGVKACESSIQHSLSATNNVIARRPVIRCVWPPRMEQTATTASSRSFCCCF